MRRPKKIKQNSKYKIEYLYYSQIQKTLYVFAESLTHARNIGAWMERNGQAPKHTKMNVSKV